MSQSRLCLTLGLSLGWWIVAVVPPRAASPQPATEVIVGGTLVDGTGRAAVHDAVLVIANGRITAAGARGAISIPAGASQIDARGQWIIPGMIDTNVHLSLYGGQNDRYESMVRYQPRFDDIVLEAAQIDLTYGITSVRDSYGALVPLTHVRDRIARGEKVGARIFAAGNILGWSGPYSFSFSRVTTPITLFQEQMNDFIAQGGGEELMEMTPAELRVAINAYMDRGPDFLKYGGTSHFSEPTFIGFSPDAQRALVEEGHKRNKFVETHSTSVEGLRVSIAAGIDGIQHPELLDGRDMPDDLVATIRERGLICSMLVSTITGPAWDRHLKTQGRSGEEDRGCREGPARPGAREDDRRAPQGSRRHRRRSRSSAPQRAEADPCRRAHHAWNRQLLGGSARAVAHAETDRSGPRRRHDPRDRRPGRARDDADAGDRRGDAQRRDRGQERQGLRHARSRKVRRSRAAHRRPARRHPQHPKGYAMS